MANLSEPLAALPERPTTLGGGYTSRSETASGTAQIAAGITPEIAPEIAGGEPNESNRWDLGTKRTVILVLLLACVVIVWISRPLIPMLVIAGIVAYFLSPIVDLAERLRIPRAISTLVLYLLLFVGIILTPFLLVPVLVSQLASLNFDVPSTAFGLFAWLGNTLSNLPDTVEILGFPVDMTGLTQQVEQNFTDFAFIPTLAEILTYIQQLISTATNVVSSTAAIGVSVVGSILQVIISFLLIFFLSLYLTKDAPSIRAYVQGLFPLSYQSEWIELLQRMGHIWQSFFRGQLALMAIVGFTTWLALELAGMPGALIFGIIAGALEIIPTLGPTLAMIPAVIVALIQGSDVLAEYGINNFGFALITVAIYFIIQQLENYILVPRIIGQGVNLHPIVVICGVAIGFNIAGILGALFAAPVLASLRIMGGYIHAKLLDYPPFQEQIAAAQRRKAVVYRRSVTGEELAAQRALQGDGSAMPTGERTLEVPINFASEPERRDSDRRPVDWRDSDWRDSDRRDSTGTGTETHHLPTPKESPSI